MAEAQTQLFKPHYRSDIDGLRAISVLAVVIFHAFPSWIRGGFIGVDVFFVISGFLISTIIFKSLDDGTFKFSEFYSRRIKRIFPALLVVLSASYLFGWFALLADEYKQLGLHIAAGTAFISNFILWREAGYFDTAADSKPMLHLWSLAVEEQFYILWPVVIWLAWKRGLSLIHVTIFIALISLAFNVMGVKQDPVSTFFLPLTRFWELLCGTILAWLLLYKREACESANAKIIRFFSRNPQRNEEEVDTQLFKNWLSLLGASILIFGFLHINKKHDFPGLWAFFPIMGAVLLIFAGEKAWVNRKILSNKFLVWIGLISFPLYLWHWVLLSFARIIESETPHFNIRISAVILSFLLAFLTYRLIESPLRRDGSNRAKVGFLVVAMAIFGALGLHTYYNEGYGSRKSISHLLNNKNELVRMQTMDDACLKYIGIEKPLFPYCRFSDANSLETIAVIGDSHAHVAYPGISEFLKGKGVNTIMLANSGCPPFLGVVTGKNQVEKEACKLRIEQLITIIASRKDIQKIFVFTRGAFYNTGTEPVTGDRDVTDGNIIPLDIFSAAAQSTFQLLSKNGKSVFYITENPELRFRAVACLERPFKITVKNCSPDKSAVLERQSDYLTAFGQLKNVTIINSLSAFCPDKSCVVFDENGSLLYADADHLSVAGSRFQMNKLLKTYLD
jgi:peptidoglycan/LPS O-acetylase OafA/YrhL